MLSVIGAVAALLVAQADPARVPTLKRLEREYLLQARADVAAFKAQRIELPAVGSWHDYRCIIHCHCYQSHDSRGKIEDIAAAAKSVGIDAIFMSDHPRQDYDVVSHGPHSEVDGVLFVPGSETDGFCLYPGDYKLPKLNVGEQALVDEIAASHGMLFIAHPEEHSNWDLKLLTGMEIYNTHADFKDEAALISALQPKDSKGYGQMLKLLNAMKEFPQEALACIFDPQPDNLMHYDHMSQNRAIAAVAGNDSHQNVGFVVKGTDDGQYLLEDVLGEKITTLDPKKTPSLKLLFGNPEPGKELFRRQLDPYAASLGYVNTHVLAKSRTEAELRASLKAARSYVAFDWIADPRGFAFTITVPGISQPLTIGDSTPYQAGLAIHVKTPLKSDIRLVHDGKVVARANGAALDYQPDSPGVYRVECSLMVAGERRDWIYSGAIRVTNK